MHHNFPNCDGGKEFGKLYYDTVCVNALVEIQKKS